MFEFEERPQQLKMLMRVGEAFANGGQHLIEAGTGVGKSLAYLLPSALHALQNDDRVVVSTNTINLQEQILGKDIPQLRRMLVAAGVIEHEQDLRVSLLKGRGNYLCLRRFAANAVMATGDPDFAHLNASMYLWLQETETGDRSELSLDHTDYLTWPRVSAAETDCLARQNTYVRDGSCFLLRARKAAEARAHHRRESCAAPRRPRLERQRHPALPEPRRSTKRTTSKKSRRGSSARSTTADA